MVATNFAGKPWTQETMGSTLNYLYPYNTRKFGRKKFVADVYGFDYYPIDWARLYNARVTLLADALKRMHEQTYNLVPVMSFVETANIRDDVYAQYGKNRYYSDPDPMYNTPTPTPQQLNMLIWLNVVHGVKGINWFHFFADHTEDNYRVMAQFLKDITELTPVVLGPETDITVTSNSNIPGNRVDTMVRRYKEEIYIFAVRLTEIDDSGMSAEHNDVITTFNVSGAGSGAVEVFNENRSISVSGGGFKDVFAPNDVHIYRISAGAGLDGSDTQGESLERTGFTVLNNLMKGPSAESVVRIVSSEAGSINVKIFDSKGKEIITLWDGYKEAGENNFPWDGTDANGKKVGSGVYMVHMKAGGYTEVKKIVVVK